MEAEAEASIVPLKHEYRRKLIEDLKATGMENVERIVRTEQGKIVELGGEEYVSHKHIRTFSNFHLLN